MHCFWSRRSALNFHSTLSQRCLMGLRSGLCEGQSRSSTPNSSDHVFMDLDLLTGEQLCWNRKEPSTKLEAKHCPCTPPENSPISHLNQTSYLTHFSQVGNVFPIITKSRLANLITKRSVICLSTSALLKVRTPVWIQQTLKINTW